MPLFANVRRDALSGMIVSLIALPLCLGIAQASGAPLFAGLVAGVIGGLVIGSLSGSALSVSGPAAGLIGIVAPAIVLLGGGDVARGFPLFLCAVMIAGAFQLLLGIVRAGGVANYIPNNVIEGMLAGIGITIILKEFPNALGMDKHEMSDGEEGFAWSDVTSAIENLEPAALAISITGIVILGLWLTRPFQRRLKLVPAGLLVVILGVVVNEVLIRQGSRLALTAGEHHLVTLTVPASAAGFFGQFMLPDFSGFANKQVWITGLVIAAVASIETLLCIEATDKLDPLKRYSNGNTELRAQGIGNMLSGLIGGLPITSVIVRSSANINAGARSKLSTIIHGSLLLICIATIPALLNHIPKAALAAILIFTGYRLARPSVAVHLYKSGGWSQLVPFLATVVCVVALDLLKGVGIGLLISVLFLLYNNARIPYYFHRILSPGGERITLELAQEVSFLNKASIKETLAKLPRSSTVVIDAGKTQYIDYDVLELIREFKDSRAAEAGITLELRGFQEHYFSPHGHAAQDEGALAPLPEVAAPDALQQPTGDYKELLKALDERQEQPA